MSTELIRVAILWYEAWFEALEEASRCYYTQKNPDAMISVLEHLHIELEKVHFSLVQIARGLTIINRAQLLHVKHLLFKSMVAIFEKLEKQPEDISAMVIRAKWIKPGICILVYSKN